MTDFNALAEGVDKHGLEVYGYSAEEIVSALREAAELQDQLGACKEQLQTALDLCGSPHVTIVDGAEEIAPLQQQLAEAERQLAEIDHLLRASVPDRWKKVSSPVGAVQSYISELEQIVIHQSGGGEWIIDALAAALSKEPK